MTGRARASTADALAPALSEPQAGRAELHALTQSASGRPHAHARICPSFGAPHFAASDCILSGFGGKGDVAGIK